METKGASLINSEEVATVCENVPEQISGNRRCQSPETETYGTVRKLEPRHIALIGIGGIIGTAIFIAIGSGLTAGGPGSLFLAFVIWCSVIYGVNEATAEIVIYLPLTSPFIRFAGRFIDPAVGVAAGWNFFVCQAVLGAFEVTAMTVILQFWDTEEVVPKAVWITLVVVLYALMNLITVKYYGESEFWLAIGKVILIIALLLMTFILMVGGNPQHRAFGFQYWRDPGAFAEYIKTGTLGRFLGFFQCLVTAGFIIAGPDYISMTAGEAINPRKTMKEAYRVVFARLVIFFVLGSLAVGILVPYNDPGLIAAIEGGKPGAAKSPYVIALKRLGVPVMPHIINGAILVSAFSAGNSFIFCASRILYGLALEGQAPKVFGKCSRRGVPVYAVLAVLAVGLLAFLSVNQSSTKVLTWFVNMITTCQLLNYAIMVVTYIRFTKALTAQGILRSELPYWSKKTPYLAYYSLGMLVMMILCEGYYVFIPGYWKLSSFLFSYAMLGVFAVIYLAWKTLKRSRLIPLSEIDLLSGKEEIDEDERRWQEAELSTEHERGKVFELTNRARKVFF